MKQLFLAAAAVFSSIPGLLVIASGLGTPPNYKVLFGGVIEAFGVIAILVLWINKNKIKKMPTRKVSKVAIVLALACILLLFTYLYLFNQSVVTVEGRGTAYYPLYISGEIAGMVNTAGSRKAAIERYGIDEVVEQIDKMPEFYSTLTTVTLLFTYQLVFTILTITFGLLGFHKGQGLATNRGSSPRQNT
jgi:hypothetical protein